GTRGWRCSRGRSSPGPRWRSRADLTATTSARPLAHTASAREHTRLQKAVERLQIRFDVQTVFGEPSVVVVRPGVAFTTVAQQCHHAAPLTVGQHPRDEGEGAVAVRPGRTARPM